MCTFHKTQSIVVSVLLLLAFIFSAPNQATAQPLPDVALLGTDVLSWISDVKAKLDATGRFNSVTGISVNLTTPTLATLQAYDAVLIWSNGSYLDPVTLGNTLADYHDAGGGVVTALFERHATVNLKLQGRWEAETYNLFAGGGFLTGTQTLGTVHDPAHPVMAGVTGFNGGFRSFRPDNTLLTTGAILVAEWSDGMPLVAVKECHNGHPRVDLGFFPPSSDVDSLFWDSATNGALLLANALSYVANPPDGNGDGILDCSDTPSVHNLTQASDHFQIQAAIAAAVNGDVIEADPGTYHETINFNGKAITLRSASGDPNDTLIDATGQTGYFHVVQCVNGEGSGTVLEGFTITGGNADDGGIGAGGGMFNQSSSPTVTNCRFSGNTAVFGGGIYNFSSAPTVTDCSFSGNTANIYGGGMYNVNSNPTVAHCSFRGNTASLSGGGMVNLNASNPTVANCTFIGNTAESGGGGGIVNNSSGNPAITNCIFSGNTATNSGGGMFNFESSPTVTNCSFSGNTTPYYGGGMFNNACSPAVTNCIFWENSDSGGMDESGQITTLSGVPVVTYCDIQGGWTGAGGTGNINADPLFVDADGADDLVGTIDDDLRLSPGSQGIDSADSFAYAGSLLDLDGNARASDDAATPDTGAGIPTYLDMGAYEIQDPCTGALTGDLNCDGIVDLLDLALLSGNWLATI